MLVPFSDGIVWLPVNRGGKARFPSLMLQLRLMVHEDVGGGMGLAPSEPEDGVVYLRERLCREAYKYRKPGCLVVADNVWEVDVATKLRETVMWVLFTTRHEDLVTPLMIDVVSEENPMSFLREASELPAGVQLPDAAYDLMQMCGGVAMDLAFVGRSSSVRKRLSSSA